MSTITVRFGSRVRVLRKERRLTQRQLAKRLGIDRSFLSDIERGIKSTSLTYINIIAKGLDLTLSELLAGVEAEPVEQDADRLLSPIR